MLSYNTDHILVTSTIIYSISFFILVTLSTLLCLYHNCIRYFLSFII